MKLRPSAWLPLTLILLMNLVSWNVIFFTLYPDSWQSKVSLAMTLVCVAAMLTQRRGG